MRLHDLVCGALAAGALVSGFARAQAENHQPDCSDQGNYVVECQGLTTSVTVTSEATDPDGDPLSYQWAACPGSFITDPTAKTTEVIVDTSDSCDITCGVRILATDPYGEAAACRLYFIIEPGSNGCSPGFWKTHLSQWNDTPYSPSNDFDTVFGVNAFSPNRTLLGALWNGGGGINKLGRVAVAALLNAADPEVPYPLAVNQVINRVRTAVTTGQYEPLATNLDEFNNLGCTLSNPPPCIPHWWFWWFSHCTPPSYHPPHHCPTHTHNHCTHH